MTRPADLATSRSQQGLTPEARMVFIGLMLGMLVASVSQTIVAPALPIIVAELGGIEHYSWLATAAMLLSAVVVPIVGKLSDLYGRRPFYMGGLIVFMLGAALSGMAMSFWWLVGARALQGLGMGALMTLSQTIIGDIMPARQRGKYQGLMGSVFGITSIIGPLIGGWVTDTWGWRWLFFAALPIGVAALIFIGKYLKLPHIQRRAELDVAGIITLSGALVAILLATSWGGTTYPWGSPQILGLYAVGAVLLAIFIPVELRAAEPVLPLRLFANSIFTFSNIASLAVSMAMFGAIFYMPVFAQGVIGVSATASGAIMIPMSAAMLLVGIGVGYLITRTGRYKIFVVGGGAIMLLGFVLISRLGHTSGEPELILAMVVLGTGLGAAMNTFTVIVQNAVSRADLGVATAATQFFRNAGATIGVALLGTVMSSRLTASLAEYLPAGARTPAGDPISADAVLNPELLPQLPDHIAEAVRHALGDGLQGVFLAGIPLALLAVIAALFIKVVPLRETLEPLPTPEQGSNR